jgi:hypothetical protein
VKILYIANHNSGGNDELYKAIRSGFVKVHNYSSPLKRFWYYVDKNGPVYEGLGKCWLWEGGIWGPGGYGCLKVDGNRVKAHRFSWLIHNGEIPKNMRVCHHCDNVLCVNPNHLFLGTDADNLSDMVSKERQNRGEERPAAKLTEDDVLEIKKIYKKGSATYGARALGRKFGVSKTAIQHIIRGQNWSYLQ